MLTSPIPIKARMVSKKGSPILAAIGVKTVANDHQTTPKPNTNLPPILSAHMPPTIYVSKKESFVRSKDCRKKFTDYLIS